MRACYLFICLICSISLNAQNRYREEYYDNGQIKSKDYGTAKGLYSSGMVWYNKKIWSSSTPLFARAIKLLQPTDSDLAKECYYKAITSAYYQVSGQGLGWQAYERMRQKTSISFDTTITKMALMNYFTHEHLFLEDTTFIIKCIDELISSCQIWVVFKQKFYNTVYSKVPVGVKSDYYEKLFNYYKSLYDKDYISDQWKTLLPKVDNDSHHQY